jgi:pepF/M3 family oligoendopeptidase
MTEATTTKPAPRWDLESIFPGGSNSKELTEYRKMVAAEMTTIEERAAKLDGTISADNLNGWIDFLTSFSDVCEKLDLVHSFAGMLTSQDVTDSKADAIIGEADGFWARWAKVQSSLEAIFAAQTDDAWQLLESHDDVKGFVFFLNEMRQMARKKMSVEKEALALELAVDGFHAWNRLYDKMAGELTVDFVSDDKVEQLSLGQLATKMAEPDRAVRKQAFEKMTSAWESREDLAAMTLNSLTGFRQTLNRNRGWNSALDEPLMANRQSQESLDAMWRVVQKNLPRLVPYIDAKKKLLGIDTFTWYDQFAPVGSVDVKYTYDEAVDFVVEQTKNFSPDLSQFCRMANDKNWIEAEDRAGKRGGAFCTGTGPLRQSRVFMTFAGSYDQLLTLAHELGHAYHSYVLRDVPYLSTWYPMTLAETASNIAEAVVNDAALDAATDDQMKLMLLDQKLQAAYTLFCDLQSRYLFDLSFYAEREKGMVSSARLRELMIDAQKEAFGGMLDESGYHPLFWCSKLHFYLTGQPFYNFPYVFGFLFAAGVYARAKAEGPSFADKYAALLGDTGCMTAEELTMKHLGVDLTKDNFWQDAADIALSGVDQFVALSNG